MVSFQPELAGRRPSRRWLVVLALLVAIALVAVAAIGLGWRRDRTETQTLKVGALEVTAPVTQGGRISAVQLPPLRDTGWAKPLAAPVRLTVDKGKLVSPARLVQRIPGRLPALVQPDRDVVFLTRHASSGQWLPVGGTYDPATHSVSLSTSHFSDWVLGVTDPAQILGEVRAARQRNGSLGGNLAGIITGDPPPLTCAKQPGKLPGSVEDVGLLVEVLIRDIVPPVKACMAVRDGGGYELELVNPHMYPLQLRLPPGVTVGQRAGDEGALQIAFMKLEEHLDGRVVLQAASKLHLDVDPDTIGPNTEVSGTIDLPIFLFDTVYFLTEVLTKGRELERLNGRDDPDSVLRQGELLARYLLDRADDVDCLLKLGDQFKENVQQARRNASFEGLTRNFTIQGLRQCAGQALSLAAGLLGRLVNVSARQLVAVLKDRVDLGWDLISVSVGQARKVLGVFSTLAAKNAGWIQDYHARVKLTRDLHIERALPAVGENVFTRYEDPFLEPRADPRFLGPAYSELAAELLADDCARGIHFLNQWAEPKVAGAMYFLQQGNLRPVAKLQLIPIRREHRQRVEQYLTGTKDTCKWDPGAPVAGGFTKRPWQRYGRISVSYDVTTPTDLFIRSLAYSSGYLLVATGESALDPNRKAALGQLLDRGFDYAARKADAMLGTAYLARR
jgi:hypothetical protein